MGHCEEHFFFSPGGRDHTKSFRLTSQTLCNSAKSLAPRVLFILIHPHVCIDEEAESRGISRSHNEQEEKLDWNQV
jgi:hypothetical protein